jgi:carbon storage regulator
LGVDSKRPFNVQKTISGQYITDTEVFHMLVLSRKESQRIKLGDSIVVTIVRVSGDKVRLGIEAPPDILVLREELEPHVIPADTVVAVST